MAAGRTGFAFFSGKGVVGKTTMACTMAVHLTRAGKRTLNITTDPASNLSDDFDNNPGHSEHPGD